MTRIVMTTGDGPHGRRVLQRIHERGITLDAVLVLTGNLGPPVARKGERNLHRLARWPRSAAGAARARARFALHRRRWYTAHADRVVPTGAMNSRGLRRDLERLAPDYLVLGGGGILRPDIIGTARVGVLNAHPSLLPWVRGCGVVGHSLERGVALGATVHLVDAGIDTGPLVARRLLSVPPGPASLADLELAAYELAAELMSDVVDAMVHRGEHPRRRPQQERFPLYRSPPASHRPAQEALARAGRAGELFEQWSASGTEADGWAADHTARSHG
jgi:folate-dependent phosphoribosylglycinamide formyltransferase PurN